MCGGNSPQKSFSSSAAARRPKPKARRPLDDPLGRALLPTPAPPGAALLASGRGPGGRKEGRPRPRAASSGCWRRRRAPAISWPRPSGPAGARPVVGSSPGPTPLVPQGRMGRALDGPEPRSAPRLLSPNLTVSVASAKGRDGTGTARSPPPFPKGAPALSPQSHAALGRRKAATLAPLLRVPDRSRSTSAAEPALRAAGAAGALTLGWFPGSDGAASAPLFAPSPRSSRFLFHPRDHERCSRHAYYGAGRRSPESERRVRLREFRRRRPRPARTPGPRPLTRCPKGPSRESRSPTEPAARGVRAPLTAPAAPTALRGCRVSPEARLRLTRRSLCRGQAASHN